MDGEPGRHAVVGQILREVVRIAARVGFPETLLLLREPGWVYQRIGRFRLTPEGVYLQKINLFEGLAEARLLQPLLPAGKHERNLFLWLHCGQGFQSQYSLRRVAARQSGEVDFQ